MQASRPPTGALFALTSLCLLGCAPAPLRGLAVPSEREATEPERSVRQLGRVEVEVFSKSVPGGYVVGLHVHNRAPRAFVIAPSFGFHELDVFRAGDGGAASIDSLRWEELPSAPLDVRESEEELRGALLRPGESLQLVSVIVTTPDWVALEGTLGMFLFPAARPSAVTLRRFRVEVPLPHDKAAAVGLPASGPPSVEAGYVFESNGQHAIGVRVRNTTAAPVVLSFESWLLATSMSFPDGSMILTGRGRVYTCSWRPTPTMCTGLAGVMLAPGGAATLLAEAHLCEQDGLGPIEVTYEFGAPGLPCQGDAWLRGEFNADKLALE
jgi:hypothetical protein